MLGVVLAILLRVVYLLLTCFVSINAKTVYAEIM